jgi:molybdopterin-guanine dinucleotide biosynthesis protein B
MLPIVAIVGRTNSGKTTLIERLIPVLSAKGYRIATVKHHHHGDFEADQPGKDSWRHARAGAVASALASGRRLALFQQLEEEMSLERIAPLFLPSPHLILAEGYRNSLYPKIEVIRRAQGMGPLCSKGDHLIALVTDADGDMEVPHFRLDAIEELADFLVARYLT